MSHPYNKQDRKKVGIHKGIRRATAEFSKSCFSLSEEYKERAKTRRRDTTTLCSCAMCGNPRKYFGERTRQELKGMAEKDDF